MPYRPALAAFLLAAGFAPAHDKSHTVTPDDYASVAAITEIAVSPDGKHVAYCEARWDAAEDNRKADLWVVSTDGKGKPRRLTFDRANDRHPRWSADGSTLYVLGNRKRAAETAPPYDGQTQVWRIPVDGGEPKAITRVPGGVAGYDLATKAVPAVFYTLDVFVTDDDAFGKLRAKHKADYGHGTRKVSELHRLDLETWVDEKIVAEKRYIREFAATRNGRRVAMITADDDTVIRSEGGSRVDVWDVDTGMVTRTDEKWKETAASPWPWLENLAWNPTGTRLAFCTVFDGYPAEIIINEWKDSGWSAGRVKRPAEVQVQGYGSRLLWGSGESLWFHGDRHGKVVQVLLTNDRANRSAPAPKGMHLVERANVIITHVVGLDEDPRDVSPVLMDRGERAGLVTLRAKQMTFPELFDEPREHADTPRKLTDIARHTKTWSLPSVRHITWKSADGTEVGGVLELPPWHKPGDKLPLVVAIHGGPTTSTKADLSFDPHNGRLYLAARGYAVLCPNYRGSTGYGDKFVTDLIGNENDLDVKDILAGIQHLIKEGIADPEKIGVMGWSNGGYLTNCLIALKDPPVRIKAASSGAGILDTVAEWGFNDEPAYPRVFKKGHPWETPDVYRKTSPTYGLGNVTTPTLIHVGGNDERCPPGHSRMLYRALKEYRKVPTELVVYPGEPHGLTKLSNRKAKMEWDIAWFDKYLLGK